MANPKRRHSNTRSRLRRAHDFLTPPALSTCKQCGAKLIPHRVCSQCGYYNGKQVITIKAKKKEGKS